jgi:hypothetical protein
MAKERKQGPQSEMKYDARDKSRTRRTDNTEWTYEGAGRFGVGTILNCSKTRIKQFCSMKLSWAV